MLEQLKKALAEDKGLLPQVSGLLRELGLTVMNDTEKKNYEDQLIAPKVRELADSIEKDIKDITGVDKQSGQKYYEYLKGTLSTFKEKATQAETLAAQIEELKKSKSTDDTLKKELDELRKSIPTLESEWKTKLEQEQNNNVTYRKRSEILQGIGALKFNPNLPQDVIETMRENAINKLLTAPSEFRDNRLVFLDEKGEVLRNKEKHLDPYSPVDLLATNLKSILDTGAGTGGAGTGGKAGGDKGGAGTFEPTSFKDQVSLHKALKEHHGKQGRTVASTEFNKDWDTYSKDLPAIAE
jgi:hypothetical protein